MKPCCYVAILITFVLSCKKLEIKEEQPQQVIDPPTALFSYTVDEDEPARYFFNNESRYAAHCVWDFGDSSTSISFSPEHVFGKVDTFLVTLTVVNELGSSVFNKEIIVKQGLVADFTFEGQGAHAPTQVRFTNKSVKGYSYTWDFGDGTYSEKKDPSHIYTKGGTYNVTLQATDIDDNSKTISRTVSILPEYTAATMTSVKLSNWPFQKPNGSEWDATPGQTSPDVYLSFEDSAGMQLYKTTTSQNLMVSCTYTTSFVLTKEAWNKVFTIRMFDDDGGTSEEMASTAFRISDYGSGTYPKQIYLNQQYISVYLNFTWAE